jgi:chromosome segregation ATPase
MSKSISVLEKSIAKLEKDIENTSIFLKRLERKRSDATHSIKLLEQNIKYMKKKNSITSASHYQKTVKAQKELEKEVKQITDEISQLSSSLKRMKNELSSLTEDLALLNKKMTPKVLSFRRKNER